MFQFIILKADSLSIIREIGKFSHSFALRSKNSHFVYLLVMSLISLYNIIFFFSSFTVTEWHAIILDIHFWYQIEFGNDWMINIRYRYFSMVFDSLIQDKLDKPFPHLKLKHYNNYSFGYIVKSIEAKWKQNCSCSDVTTQSQ